MSALVGALNIHVGSAQSGGLSTSAKKDEKYMCVASLSHGAMNGMLRTSYVSGEAMSWNASVTSHLLRQLKSNDRIILTVFEKGVFTDNMVAKGAHPLADLLAGKPIDAEVAVCSKIGNLTTKFCTVGIKISWKSAPLYVSQQTASPDPQAHPTVPPRAVGLAKQTVGAAQEASLPRCEGNDYNIRIVIHKARNLQSPEMTELYSPVCNVSALGHSVSSEVSHATNNPIWEEELSIECSNVTASFWNAPVLVRVEHHHALFPNETIGGFQIDCATIYRSQNHAMLRKFFVLHKFVVGGLAMGFLKLTICVLNAKTDPLPDIGEDTFEEDEETLVSNLVGSASGNFEQIHLCCEAHRAMDLPQMDVALFSGAADPFLSFRFGACFAPTRVVSSDLNPVWNHKVRLPIMLPSLTSALSILCFDSDTIGSSELIGSVKLDILDVIGNRRSKDLPFFAPRFITLYGCPRDYDAGFNDYFKRMNKSEVPGVDYRGRILIGLKGTRDPPPPIALSSADPSLVPQPVKETVVSFVALVQVLQLSMVPMGTYRIRAFCGLFESVSQDREAVNMHNSDLASVYFGQELRVTGSLPIIVPSDTSASQYATVAQQIPDVILHLIIDGKSLPLAAIRFPATGLIEKKEGQYECAQMRVLLDPRKVGQGEQPTQPLIQAVFAMYITGTEPPNPNVSVHKSIVMPALSQRPPKSFALECCVYHARKIPAGDDNGLSDPFVRISWANGSAQTGTKLETLNPMYNELLVVEAEARDPFPSIVVELWDYDFWGSNTFLGQRTVPFSDATDDETAGKMRWYSGFVDSQGVPIPECDVLISFEIAMLNDKVRQSYAKLPRHKFLKKVGDSDTYEGLRIPDGKLLPTSVYKISVSIAALRHMKPVGFFNISAPNVETDVAGNTVAVEKVVGMNPDFDKAFDMYAILPSDGQYLPQLNFRVFDNGMGPKKLLGVASIQLDSEQYSPQYKDHARQQGDNAVARRIAQMTQFKGKMLNEIRDKKSARAPVAIKNKNAKMRAAAELVKLEARHRDKSAKAKTDPAMNHELQKRLLDDEVGHYEGVQDREDSTGVDIPGQAPDAITKFLTTFEQEERANELEMEEDEAPEDSWFERFDPVGSTLAPENIVSRLGDMKGITPPFHSTMEDYFGPFDDEHQALPLRRGWGSNAVRAGTLLMDLTVVKVPQLPTEELVRIAPVKSRQPLKFMLHLYIVRCAHLAAKDDSILGKLSDPYVVFELTNKSNKADTIKLKCDGDKKFQTLNPEFFLTKVMEGILPTHNVLRVSVYDYDRIGRDELIGFTEINLEDRWYSHRGYKKHNMGTLKQGTYTEERELRNARNQKQGKIEMWVDMYHKELQKVPHPIDITPPPPVPLELRIIVWNTRDVLLQDVSVHGEDMTDIYVRAWLDGMQHDVQCTDVHYRSLDGTGNFNWRMIFPVIFEPRSRKILPVEEDSSFFSSFFSVRKEPKKFDPVLRLQIFDNDLIPGTDDFIGETDVRLLAVHPCARKQKATAIDAIINEVTKCCDCWPFNTCCMRKVRASEMSFQEGQALAAAEAAHDREVQEKVFRDKARRTAQALREKGGYTAHQLATVEEKVFKDLKREAEVNIFKQFMPQPAIRDEAPKSVVEGAVTSVKIEQEKDEKGKADKAPADGKPAVTALGHGIERLPKVIETPKYWVACNGPRGGGRVGDIQISFQVVRRDAAEKDKTLHAGKGRSEPNALPAPNRPDTSFFWLSSPWKSAVHILWKNYKWWIITIFCLCLIALFLYVFSSEGIRMKAQKFFD